MMFNSLQSLRTLLADSTVFDLPEERLQMLDVAFEPGAFRYLRVTCRSWTPRRPLRRAP